MKHFRSLKRTSAFLVAFLLFSFTGNAALADSDALLVTALAESTSNPVETTAVTTAAETTTATTAAAETTKTALEIYSINDFHGRIESNPSSKNAGIASIAGAINSLRSENPNSIFVSAGDNIGASTFTSYISQDMPTIDSLVAAGLQVSTVGNHEFDYGIDHLKNLVLPRYGQGDPAKQAALGLGANVRDAATGDALLPEYTIIEQAGLRIGFIGTVTENTATAVNPAYISGVKFASQLETVNRVASEIDDLVDLTILLVHDGAYSTQCAEIEAEDSVFGKLVREASPLIDGIVSGHSHLAYNCVLNNRPVVQAGFYGQFLGNISFEIETAAEDTHTIKSASANLIPLINEQNELVYSELQSVKDIVTAAQISADEIGREPVGQISSSILRGGNPPGSDRSVESALGNLLADVTLDAVLGADIGVMNAGGLREDLIFRTAGDPALPLGSPAGTLTYRDIATVQPFANTIVSVKLTGAQLKTLLEQQWSFSRGEEFKRNLSVSKGFSYTYLPDNPNGERIMSMSLNGSPIESDNLYTIAVIEFLANGGDDLAVFTEGTDRVDTGLNDLQVSIEFFKAAGVVSPPNIGRAMIHEPDAPEPDTQTQPDQETESQETEDQETESWHEIASLVESNGELEELSNTGSASNLMLLLAAAFLAVGVMFVTRSFKLNH